MSYADKTLRCKDCGAEFVFTAGEQEFYAQKGFINEPTRCPSCRRARKSGGGGGRGGYSDSGYSDRGGYSDSGYSSGGRGGYSSDREGGYSDRGWRSGGSGGGSGFGGERQFYTAVCASCGGEARVPFVPRGDKPVYCSNCFQEQRRQSGGGRSNW
jgi:CxxC-x17-CxxC domain-containing protein